ncbi:uncharacterized protein C8R40DRAFT_1178811 [Lentinula edodes]|uniref:uncharacterized protein n=1 Tax=Lentinula edodes TaxID=5353 RepID=UPI001E8E5C16|nr:uncharacterized protein C8R40DRAFT_1178811 [Lentinula edodes]KAH7867679.1 hypothetical protein C8R40DRAFT_1178811 [Lentinula edodes]
MSVASLTSLLETTIVIGYRFVDQNQALSEYNRFRTVRAILATDEEKELLEGVYLTSSLDLRPDSLPSNYWECKMTANDKLLSKRPMASNSMPLSRSIYQCLWYE